MAFSIYYSRAKPPDWGFRRRVCAYSEQRSEMRLKAAFSNRLGKSIEIISIDCSATQRCWHQRHKLSLVGASSTASNTACFPERVLSRKNCLSRGERKIFVSEILSVVLGRLFLIVCGAGRSREALRAEYGVDDSCEVPRN